MKLEITLTTDEYDALRTVPGASQQQRLKWLITFWRAVSKEHEDRTAAEEKIRAEVDKARLTVVPDLGAGPGVPIGNPMLMPVVKVSREELAKQYPDAVAP